MKRRKRPFQVTCRCTKYHFPHRITGGKCTGAAWAKSYYALSHEFCGNCLENDGVSCAVAESRESIAECEGLHDVMHRHISTNFPCTEEVYFERIEERHDDVF